MTFEQFDKFQKELFDEVFVMRDTKGREYANSENRFANFQRLSNTLGISDIMVAWVYAQKHFDSIAYAIRNDKFEGNAESFRGRIVDGITYLTLILGMVEDKLEYRSMVGTDLVEVISLEDAANIQKAMNVYMGVANGENDSTTE